MNEIWRPIPGFEGQYEVSSLGRVRSLPRDITYTTTVHRVGKILKTRPASSGYPQVWLPVKGKGFQRQKAFNVDRLVKEVFGS